MHITRNTPAFVEDARLLQEMGRWPVGGGGSDLSTRQRGVRSRPGEVDTEGSVSGSRLTGWWDGRASPESAGQGAPWAWDVSFGEGSALLFRSFN